MNNKLYASVACVASAWRGGERKDMGADKVISIPLLLSPPLSLHFSGPYFMLSYLFSNIGPLYCRTFLNPLPCPYLSPFSIFPIVSLSNDNFCPSLFHIKSSLRAPGKRHPYKSEGDACGLVFGCNLQMLISFFCLGCKVTIFGKPFRYRLVPCIKKFTKKIHRNLP